jgi:PilZ domain
MANWLGLSDEMLQRWDVGLALVFGMVLGAVAFQACCFYVRRWWERRRAGRRWGNPVAVMIDTGWSKKTSLEGTILNRSDGGIGILVNESFSPGDQLLIRAKEAPPSVPRVRVDVKHCQPTNTGWMIGCKFHEGVDWDTLVWFG